MPNTVRAVPDSDGYELFKNKKHSEQLFLNSLLYSDRKRVLRTMPYVKDSDFDNPLNAELYRNFQKILAKDCYEMNNSNCLAKHNLIVELRELNWFRDDLNEQIFVHVTSLNGEQEDVQIAGCRLLEESLRTSLITFSLNIQQLAVTGALEDCLQNFRNNTLIPDKAERLRKLQEATNIRTGLTAV